MSERIATGLSFKEVNANSYHRPEDAPQDYYLVAMKNGVFCPRKLAQKWRREIRVFFTPQAGHLGIFTAAEYAAYQRAMRLHAGPQEVFLLELLTDACAASLLMEDPEFSAQGSLLISYLGHLDDYPDHAGMIQLMKASRQQADSPLFTMYSGEALRECLPTTLT